MSKQLVFFGSGPIGFETLRAIHKPLDVSVVVTKPVPEHGHKTTPPIIKYAQENNIELHTPSNKQELSNLFNENILPSLCGIVVDYGLIIPESVIDHFELGIINSHFSLLPKWRGADPITFPLLEGEDVTGVTLMQIVPALDEGDMVAKSELAIEANDNNITLSEKLVDLSNQMLINIIPEYIEGNLQPVPQPDGASYSRKLTKADGEIDWNKPADVIAREVRAFAGWPKSYTTIAGKDVVVTAAHATDAEGGKPGTVTVQNKELVVATSDGSLVIDKLKVAGKPEMDSMAFLAGYKHLL